MLMPTPFCRYPCVGIWAHALLVRVLGWDCGPVGGDDVGETIDGKKTLDVWYPNPALNSSPIQILDATSFERKDSVRGCELKVVKTIIKDLSKPAENVEDAYLRLHLLSHRLVKPRTINLEGIFAILNNVAWTTIGPVLPEKVEQVRATAKKAGQHLTIFSVDK
mgnify:CR=1 FL=1